METVNVSVDAPLASRRSVGFLLYRVGGSTGRTTLSGIVTGSQVALGSVWVGGKGCGWGGGVVEGGERGSEGWRGRKRRFVG